MKLLLATDSPNAAGPLAAAVAAAGWRLLAPAFPHAQATRQVAALQPDALVMCAAAVERGLLRELHNIRLRTPLPVVLLTADGEPDNIGLAIRAGVNAYVAGCSEPRRIGHLLEVARARFAEVRAMQVELDEFKARLAERKRIERAKGIIMQRRSLQEDAAYHLLRKLAMDRNKRIGEIADQILDTADLLL